MPIQILFTHNLRRDLTDETQAEFDTPETVESVATALGGAGRHAVELLDVSAPLPEVMAKLSALQPDLVFNTAEGRLGRARAAQMPAILEMMGLAFVGSDSYVLAVTQDKWLTKQAAAAVGVPTPRSRLFFGPSLPSLLDAELEPLLPAIVKPNYEGSSKGISDDNVVQDVMSLRAVLARQLAQFPQGVLVERFLAGRDVTVPFVAALGQTTLDGVLTPVEYCVESQFASRFNLYDYRLKNIDYTGLSLCCPARLSDSELLRIREMTASIVQAFGIVDLARADFRVDEAGNIHFLEVNPLPSLEAGASLFVAAERAGYSFEQTISAIVDSAYARFRAAAAHS